MYVCTRVRSLFQCMFDGGLSLSVLRVAYVAVCYCTSIVLYNLRITQMKMLRRIKKKNKESQDSFIQCTHHTDENAEKE